MVWHTFYSPSQTEEQRMFQAIKHNRMKWGRSIVYVNCGSSSNGTEFEFFSLVLTSSSAKHYLNTKGAGGNLSNSSHINLM